jgi:nicotinamide-nucleotide amidase
MGGVGRAAMTMDDRIVRRARRVLEVCRAQELMLATAESCTGGLIAAALTEIAGSSTVVERGFVTYTNEAKTEMLGVPVPMIAVNGAVSEPVARAMAEGAILHSNAQIAVSVTGIAGPGGATPGKPVGTVHMACAREGCETIHAAHRFRGDRAAVRAQSVIAALDMVLHQATRRRNAVSLPGRGAPSRVVGVDFSGAAQAGKAIWIASGPIDGDTIRIERLIPATELPNGAAARDRALAALVDYMAGETDAAIGLDFPFGLPKRFVRERDWFGFVRAFPKRFPTVESLSALGGTPRSEPRRVCDSEAKTPFSAINRRVVHQTWAGIALVLRPLILADLARVPPMQRPRDGAPILLEICPASTLKAEGIYWSYKGRSTACRAARRAILDTLVARGLLARPARAIERTATDDVGGDALDAIVAAVGAHRALYDPRIAAKPDAVAAKEGVVFC